MDRAVLDRRKDVVGVAENLVRACKPQVVEAVNQTGVGELVLGQDVGRLVGVLAPEHVVEFRTAQALDMGEVSVADLGKVGHQADVVVETNAQC